MKRATVAACLFVVCGSSFGQIDLCSLNEYTFRWTKDSRASSVPGVAVGVSSSNGEARYHLTARLQCAADVSVRTYEHGRVVSKDESGSSSVRFFGDSGSGGGAIRFTSGKTHDTGASHRLEIDGKEVCRQNDGPISPPGPGPWISANNFENFYFSCDIATSIDEGDELNINFYRWNTNAEPVDLIVEITFLMH